MFRITTIPSDKENHDEKNIVQVTERERLVEAYDELSRKEPPFYQFYYRLRKVLIAEDGTEIQFEEKLAEWVIYPRSAIYINHQGNIQQLFITDTIDDLCLVPGTTQFITWRSINKIGIRISLWDWATEELRHIEEFHDDDIYKNGLVDIACSHDFFILSYRSVKPGISFLEIRDIQSFKLLSRREITGHLYFSNCMFPPHLPETAVFINGHGFECWQISRKKDDIELQKEEIHFAADSFNCIDIIPGTRMLVSGHNDRMRFWNLGDKTTSTSLIKQQDPSRVTFEAISNVCVTPDGKHLISWNEHNVVLWDISDVTKPDVLARHYTHHHIVLGQGQSVLTDDWKLITPFTFEIEFKALQEASQKYRKDVMAAVTDHKVTRLPPVLGEIVMDYGFFSMTQPVRIHTPQTDSVLCIVGSIFEYMKGSHAALAK